MNNIFARDKQIQEMNHQNNIHNQEATEKFLMVSQRAATVYRDKKAA